MIDNIIQSVTEKLSSLPYIEGIVLGGSRARGTHTEDSDIDSSRLALKLTIIPSVFCNSNQNRITLHS